MHSPLNVRLLQLVTCVFALLTVLILAPCPLYAQPSGGPYGPVQQTYEVPKTATHVYYVAPDGKSDAKGSSIDEPMSLESAIERVVTGDAIILHGGTYRTGGLKLNQSVTFQPFKDERPIINGTKIATDWENLHNGQWRTKWATLFPSAPQDWWRREREAARTPLIKFNNDLVFADGKRLHPVGWAGDVKEETYWVDYEKGFVYIGTDPSKKQIEITAFDSALIQSMANVHDREPDHKGSTIRGITFTQFAYRALEIEGRDPEGVSPEAEHGNDVAGAVFENCTISHCSRVAGYFRGNHLVIRHCLVSDTGTEGIYVLGSNDILLERNIVTRNNVENITGYYASAVKIFNQCYRATCRENLIIDNGNGSCGVWYDVGEVDGVFVNNWVERTDNGFFFEISKGATCAGNVFVDCGTGVKILNSRDVHVYQNTLVDSTLWIERSPRSAANDHFGWHPATGPDVDEREGHVVVGNLMFGNQAFARPLLVFAQSAVLHDRLTKPQAAEVDYNVYVTRGTPSEKLTSVYNIPTDFTSPEQLQAADSKFETHSRTFRDYFGPLFKGEQLSRFELLSGFPGADSAAPLPPEVLKLLGWTGDKAAFPGAFPVAP